MASNLPLGQGRQQDRSTEDPQAGYSQSFKEDMSLSRALGQKLTIESLLSQKLTAESLLSRLLSTKSTISTASSFAQAQQDAVYQPESRKFFSIGEGRLGRVYDWIGTARAAKICMRSDDIELRIEAAVHKLICDTYDLLVRGKAPVTFHVPKFYNLLVDDAAKKWWAENGTQFPADDKSKAIQGHTLLLSERILPLPKVVREALIDTYFKEADRAAAKQNPLNRDCLIRVYLGSQRTRFQYGILRNMPLTLAQMHILNLPLDDFASAMATALAMLHFGAKVDAHDVEFVLGTQPYAWKFTPAVVNFRDRYLQLWILDFNQCGEVTMDEEGMNDAVQAYFDNDPYFPRPYLACYGSALGSLSLPPTEATKYVSRLWTTFRNQYVVAGKRFLDDNNSTLPEMFIHTVEQRAASKKPGWKAMQ